MRKFKNKIKNDFYENYKDEIEKQNYDFITLWNDAIRYSRAIYKMGNANKLISEIATDLIRDTLSYRNTGILNLVSQYEDKKTGKRYLKAERQIYKLRTQAYFEKYGEQVVEFNGEKQTLNEWFEDYLDSKNKIIGKEQMNEIIKKAQIESDIYKLQEYGKKNHESRNSVN